MKESAKEGCVQPKKQAKAVTMSEEDKLWDLGLLSEDMPKKLVNTLIYLIGIHFALHGGEEHKQLKVGVWSNINIKYDEDLNLRFLEYKATGVKNNQGRLRDCKRKEKVVVTYENKDKLERCLVCLYEKYLALHPNSHPKCSQDLYLCLLAKVPAIPHALWYSLQAMGLHSIQGVLSGLCV